MTWKLSTEHKVAVGALVALATILVIALMFYLSNRGLISSNAQLANTSAVQVRLSNILAEITEAETSQRGFLLTGDDEFLRAYDNAVELLGKEFQKLRFLTEFHPAQKSAIDDLEVLIRQRLQRIEQGIELRKSQGFNAALDLISTKKGNELMRRIRAVIRQIGSEQQASLAYRHERFRINSRRTFLAFSSLIVANFALLSLVYYVVKRDLAQRRRAQEKQNQLLRGLALANKELNDFAYVVSHDLKAPLRGIASLASFLMADYRDKLDADGQEQLRLLSTRVQRMHQLIDGILQYSRMVRHHEKESLVNVNQLAQESIDLLAPPSHIRVRIRRPLPAVVCEKTLLQQVFQNLLSNAIKFMDKAQGEIVIDCSEAGAFWRFSIADNGRGIEEKYFAKIFQLFQTLNPRDEFENTGIGLALVKKAVEGLGGEVWVESKPGVGTTFLFSLPRKD